MIFKQFVIGCMLVFLISCKTNSTELVKIEGKQVPITESVEADKAISDFIKPYHDHVIKSLDTVLAYAPHSYSKKDGDYNTALGNLMADMVYEQSNPVFHSRTNHNIDFVILNNGGIRAPISKGDVTLRTAYELMPFENSIVIAAIKGSNVNKAITYLSRAKQPHPISGLTIEMNSNYEVTKALVKGQAVDENKTYYVATNDYLYNGGDNMTFFKPNDSLYVLNYKLRNAIVDYFTKVDTINPVIDNRFIQTK